MEHNILSLDFWQDTATYEGQTMPSGTLGCAALNIPDAVIDKLDELCAPINGFMKTLTSGMPDPALLPEAKEAAEKILKLLHTVPPFEYLDMDFYIPNICKAFTPEGIQKYQAYSFAFMTGTLTLEQTEEYKHVKRGTLDAVLAEVMKKLAKDKMLRALSNVTYAKGDYKKEMEQATLQKEAKTMK